MKRYIRALDYRSFTDGYIFNFKNKIIFIETDSTTKTDKIVREVLKTICDLRGLGPDSALRHKVLYDKPTLDDVRKRMDKASLDHINDYYRISGKGLDLHFTDDEFEDTVVII